MHLKEVKEGTNTINNDSKIITKENQGKPNRLDPPKEGNFTSKDEKLNASCASCDCPCDLKKNFESQIPPKKKINGVNISEHWKPPKASGKIITPPERQGVKEKDVIELENDTAPITSKVSEKQKDLIQSGVIVDISSLKGQGLENAENDCKYKILLILVYSYIDYLYCHSKYSL